MAATDPPPAATSTFLSQEKLDPTLYQFVKEVILSAKSEWESLDKQGKLSKFVSALASAAPSQRIPDSITKWIILGGSRSLKIGDIIYKYFDECSREKKKIVLKYVVTKESPKEEKLFHLMFILIWIEPAIEIFYSYQNQLNSVYLKVDRTARDYAEGRSRVAKLVGKLCFSYLVEQKSSENLTKVLTQLDQYTLSNLSSWFTEVMNHRFVTKLRMDWNGEKISLSTYHVLERPVPAWSITKENLNTQQQQVGAKVPSSCDHLGFWSESDMEKFKKENYRAIFLRRPLKFEWDQYKQRGEEGNLKTAVQNIPKLADSKYFIWKDGGGADPNFVAEIYQKLISDVDIDPQAVILNFMKESHHQIMTKLDHLQESQGTIQANLIHTKKAVESIDQKLISTTAQLRREIVTTFNTMGSSHPNTLFSGRTTELDHLMDLLEVAKKGKLLKERIVVVTGMAGVGKTSVVRKCADMASQNGENVAWIHADSKESMTQSFSSLARQLNIAGDIRSKKESELTSLDRGQLVRDVFAHFSDHVRQGLFIYDSAHQMSTTTNQLTNVDVEGILDFLPSGANLVHLPVILVTSICRDWGDEGGIQPLQLTCLNPQESLEMLKKCIVLRNKSLEKSVQEGTCSDMRVGVALGQLNNILDGFPLALSLVGANIAQSLRARRWQRWPLEKVVKELVTEIESCVANYEKDFKTLETQAFPKSTMDRYDKTISTVWLGTLRKIEMVTKASSQLDPRLAQIPKLALETLYLVAYLPSNRIGIRWCHLILRNLSAGKSDLKNVPADEVKDFEEALGYLEDFSLLSIKYSFRGVRDEDVEKYFEHDLDRIAYYHYLFDDNICVHKLLQRWIKETLIRDGNFDPIAKIAGFFSKNSNHYWNEDKYIHGILVEMKSLGWPSALLRDTVILLMNQMSKVTTFCKHDMSEVTYLKEVYAVLNNMQDGDDNHHQTAQLMDWCQLALVDEYVENIFADKGENTLSGRMSELYEFKIPPSVSNLGTICIKDLLNWVMLMTARYGKHEWVACLTLNICTNIFPWIKALSKDTSDQVVAWICDYFEGSPAFIGYRELCQTQKMGLLLFRLNYVQMDSLGSIIGRVLQGAEAISKISSKSSYTWRYYVQMVHEMPIWSTFPMIDYERSNAKWKRGRDMRKAVAKDFGALPCLLGLFIDCVQEYMVKEEERSSNLTFSLKESLEILIILAYEEDFSSMMLKLEEFITAFRTLVQYPIQSPHFQYEDCLIDIWIDCVFLGLAIFSHTQNVHHPFFTQFLEDMKTLTDDLDPLCGQLKPRVGRRMHLHPEGVLRQFLRLHDERTAGSAFLIAQKLEGIFFNPDELISDLTDEGRFELGFHPGVQCDGCGVRPIMGVRFKCKICPDFDLCKKCKTNDSHNQGHSEHADFLEMQGIFFVPQGTPMPPLYFNL